jgi:hypothetical protein
MFTKLILVLAVSSLAALALRYLSDADDEASLEREIAGQLDGLREHLFRR